MDIQHHLTLYWIPYNILRSTNITSTAVRVSFVWYFRNKGDFPLCHAYSTFLFRTREFTTPPLSQRATAVYKQLYAVCALSVYDILELCCKLNSSAQYYLKRKSIAAPYPYRGTAVNDIKFEFLGAPDGSVVRFKPYWHACMSWSPHLGGDLQNPT